MLVRINMADGGRVYIECAKVEVYGHALIVTPMPGAPEPPSGVVLKAWRFEPGSKVAWVQIYPMVRGGEGED